MTQPSGSHRYARFSWLDFKVGFRMLARYPGITVVGTVAIAVAIALGTVYFEATTKLLHPRIPVPDGDRLVEIRLRDVRQGGEEARALHDFALLREQVRTVEKLGAAASFTRNLVTEDGLVEPVQGAEVTPNALQLFGAAPLLGRVFTELDQLPSEPPVVVLGHPVWQNRFDSDPGVIGRTVRLGSVTATIVGVMPEGFRFPSTERIWAPLRVDGATLEPRTGPAVALFGHLAPGVSMSAAQAELDAVEGGIAAAYPETHEHMIAQVSPYGAPPDGGDAGVIRTVLRLVNVIFLALLAVVSINVATLVFARTATRSWEITVRSALGASRARIIGQLFVEALVLAGLAAVVGLILARVALSWGLARIGGGGALPFWIDASLSWRTFLYTAVLTLFGAAIVGILPALRATRMNVQEALRNESAGRAGLRFGGFWTTVIVVQVAITVALMPLAAAGVFESNRFMQRAEGIGAERYLTASVAMDREDYVSSQDAFAARARAAFEELERALTAEPNVEAVAFADRLPVMDQFKYRIELDTLAGAPANAGLRSTLVQVSGGFFNTFGTSVVTGRDFTPGDFENGRVMIVNESFVRHVLGGRNAVGQRVRIVAGEISTLAGDTWYEVVGVVRDFGWQLPRPEEQSAMYRPLPVPAAGSMNMAVRLRDPEGFAGNLRTVALAVDPRIRLTDVQPLARVGGGEAAANWTLTSVAWLIAFVVLTLSATGIHALMSFTVSRRTREIGIRAALGARPGRIVAGVFWRAFLQISAGIVAGSAVAALAGVRSPREILILLAADAVMLLVGLAACAMPLRRALSIDPTEALRAEV